MDKREEAQNSNGNGNTKAKVRWNIAMTTGKRKTIKAARAQHGATGELVGPAKPPQPA